MLENNLKIIEQKKLFTILRVGELYGYKIRHLSAGQLQRLKIYISLISKNDLILFDEPFNTLDKNYKNIFIKILIENKLNKSFLISGHQQNELIEVCDEYVFIEEAKIFHKKQDNLQFINEYVIKSKSRILFGEEAFLRETPN